MTETAAPPTTRLPDGTELVLRIPSTREVQAMILLPHLRTEQRLAVTLPLLFKRMVATVNGAPTTLAQADAWAADSAIAGPLLGRLRALLEAWSEDGIAYAECPACRQWEADLTTPALVTALAAEMPPIFEGPFLAIPALARGLRRGWRPGELPVASRLRAVLPSSQHALDTPVCEVVLGEVEPGHGARSATFLTPGAREAAAWARWVPGGARSGAGFEHWRTSAPAFPAELRLALAIDPHGLGDPELVDRMPAVDFYYLDALYWLAYGADVRDPRRAAVQCARCDTPFLPVR